MHVLIVGTGVVGTICGWALAESGNEVTHLIRHGRAGEVEPRPQLDIVDRRKGHPKHFVGTYHRHITDDLTSGPSGWDLVIVPTKPSQVLDALATTVPHTVGAGHLLLTQNWSGMAEIEGVIPRNRFGCGELHVGGSIVDGTLVGAIHPASVVLGDLDGAAPEVMSTASDLFESSGFKLIQPEHILDHLRVQYAINAGLWPGVVRAGGIESLLGDRRTATLSLRAVSECLDVVAARGVDLRPFREARLFRRHGLVKRAIPRFGLQLLLGVSKSARRTSTHALSDPDEIIAAHRIVTAAGHDLGVDMPAMASFADDIDRLASGR
jgi:2-dehydropantoate 2-reductase